MAIEIRLKHIRCNLACKYCYERPLRKSNNISREVNIDAIKKSIASLSEVENDVVISGGEPLLVEFDRLKEIIKFSSQYVDRIGIQTNGALISKEHIELFKKYRVTVGVSIDGPDRLNDYRWAGSMEKTREATQRTIENLAEIKPNNLSGGVILTVHKANAGDDERLQRLKEFVLRLAKEANMHGGNMHMLQIPSDGKKLALSQQRNKEVFLELAKFIKNYPRLDWKPFSDLEQFARGNDREVSCIWTNCDPWCTRTLRGIEPDGSITSCSRGLQAGVEPRRAENMNYIRYLSLYNTPQSKGGCKNCRFFVICSGLCPGGGLNNDWRNRTFHCKTIKALLDFYEKRIIEEGETPLTRRPEFKMLEKWFVDKLRKNKQPRVHRGLEQFK